MAKDVDLSSREWRDLVFQGKNKEFGAYTMRQDSVKRHNKAVIIVLSILAALLVVLILVMTGVFKSADEDVNAKNEQENVQVDADLEEEDTDEEEIEYLPEEEEIPDVQEEEDVAATQQVTELVIAAEVDKEREVKDISETLENTSQFGAEDRAGVEDQNREAVIKEVVQEAPKVEEKPKPKDEGPMTMAMVEQKPSFPGGDAAMMKWLGENIIYPAAAAEEGVSGKVTIQFVVERDGSVSNVKVARGKHPALDAEAVRVVKKMPKWTPGRNNGQPVRVTYLLPVTFKLQQ